SGFYQSWLNIGSPAALVSTPYGRALLVKLGSIVPLVALAAVNLLWLRPRLAQTTRSENRADLVRHLRWSVLGEIVFAVAVLLVVGVMTNLQPGREAFLSQGVQRTARDEDVRGTIRVQPAVAP